jgi:uncharacterized OB-fold protein
MSKKERVIPAPIPTEETKAFWEAAKEGRFVTKRCNDCGEFHWYPRALCPFCFSGATEWRQVSGNGVIYSYSVMRRAPEPYAVAFVTLEEGPTMLTNLVDCDFDRLAIGQAVQMVFRSAEDGTPVPMFRPL